MLTPYSKKPGQMIFLTNKRSSRVPYQILLRKTNTGIKQASQKDVILVRD